MKITVYGCFLILPQIFVIILLLLLNSGTEIAFTLDSAQFFGSFPPMQGHTYETIIC